MGNFYHQPLSRVYYYNLTWLPFGNVRMRACMRGDRKGLSDCVKWHLPGVCVRACVRVCVGMEAVCVRGMKVCCSGCVVEWRRKWRDFVSVCQCVGACCGGFYSHPEATGSPAISTL